MFEAYETEDRLNDPEWFGNVIIVEFTFAGGLTKTIEILTEGKSPEEIRDIRKQLLGKRKLIQSIFEHNTHGQISVLGLTVRADDLIAFDIRCAYEEANR